MLYPQWKLTRKEAITKNKVAMVILATKKIVMDDDTVGQSMTPLWKKKYKEQLINTKVARDDQ